MGPFFALGHALGLPDWVVGRLWIGAVLALSAWGWCACSTRSPGARAAPATWPAALLYMLNPYVVTYAGAHVDHAAGHGGAAVAAAVRAPRAARSARLAVAGGVRARADLDRAAGSTSPSPRGCCSARRCWSSTSWAGAACAAARRGRSRCGSCRSPRSPRCGGSLPCSSTRATAWTSCPTPSSRGRSGARRRCPSRCGCWASGRATSASATPARCAPSRPTPASTLGSRRSSWRRCVMPALCLGSFAWTRRARYAPFFLALVLLGLLVMVVGFPEGTPLRRAATFTYNHVAGRAVPAHELQGGAAGRRSGSPASARWALRRCARGCARRGAASAAAALVARRVLAAGARRRPGPPARAPARRARGVARRRPRPRPHAAARPARDGPARPALRLLRLGRDLRPDPAGADRPARWRRASSSRSPTCARSTCSGRPTRSSASSARCPGSCGRCSTSWASAPSCRAPTTTARAAARCRPPRRPRSCARSGPAGARLRAAAHGARRGRDARARRARCRRCAAGTCRPAGMVRVLPRDGATVVDGSARRHRRPRRLRRAADRPRAALRRRPDEPRCAPRRRAGASFVISDSNRRRVFVAARLRGNTGWTVPAGEKLSEDSAQLDPFPRRGTDAQTVARRGRRRGLGPRRLLARLRPVPRAPPVRRARRRPVDGVAGRPRAGHRSPPPGRGLHGAARRRPRRPACPTATARVACDRVAVNGREFAVHDGWNRLQRRVCAACAR